MANTLPINSGAVSNPAPSDNAKISPNSGVKDASSSQNIVQIPGTGSYKNTVTGKLYASKAGAQAEGATFSDTGSSGTMNKVSTPTYSPAVITSSTAKQDLGKVQDFFTTTKDGIAKQTADNAAKQQQTKAEEQQAAEKATADKLAADTLAIKKKESDAKSAALTGKTPTTENPVEAPTTPAESAYSQELKASIEQSNQAYAEFKKAQTAFQNGTMPLSSSQQALLDSTSNAFDQMVYQAQLRGAAASSQTGGYSNQITQNLGVLTNIQTQKAASLANMETGFQEKNYKMVLDGYNAYMTYDKQITDKLKSINDEVVRQSDEMYTRYVKPIQDVAGEAAKNGAPKSILDKISASKDVNSALSEAGMYLQTASGTLGDYLQYKKDTMQKGLTPTDYQTFKDQQDAKAAKLEASKAYNNAYSSAKGKADAEAAIAGTTPADTIESTSQSIMGQTGLSAGAFAYATQGSAGLTRMSGADRTKYMNEWRDYQIKHNIDGATFKSQYEALNHTVAANLLRNNQATVTEEELKGTIGNIRSASQEAGLGDLSGLNAAKIFAGKQLNDAKATTFKFHLEQIRKEYATYNAVLGGGIDANGNVRALTPEDYKAADDVIQNGFAAGSIDGFEKALNNSTDKMRGVLSNSVNAQNKQVWNLFGVGNKYQAPVDPKAAVDSYVAKNPDQAEKVAKAYTVPGTTDQDVADYFNLLTPKIENPIK
jgi:hypothetical protein